MNQENLTNTLRNATVGSEATELARQISVAAQVQAESLTRRMDQEIQLRVAKAASSQASASVAGLACE